MTERVHRADFYIERVAAWFGIGGLSFRLTITDGRRLLYASAAPIAILAGDLILLLLQIFEHIPFSVSQTSPPDQGGIWWHIYYLITSLRPSLLPLAVALLLVFAIRPVNRAQATASLVIVIAFIGFATCLALFAAFPHVAYSNNGTATLDWYSDRWAALAYDFAFLSVGYAFLAFRGLGASILTRPRRRIRVRDDQPREL